MFESQPAKLSATASPQSLHNKSKRMVYKDGRFSKQRFQNRKDIHFSEPDVKTPLKTLKKHLKNNQRPLKPF